LRVAWTSKERTRSAGAVPIASSRSVVELERNVPEPACVHMMALGTHVRLAAHFLAT
jgi:hypothetical protein